ncbi:hypothetical protein L1987_55766 [Smallanthus sonchifolius]|uniref:Uncharacterized protein n=1 Tax=Smallanthus sonchifolius TaxID=185202 RepID=A0ACB9EAZ7_9ASTR|nr:hypothetical protein L1987_55766 [Smallanthus sonchifolius]
MMIGSPSGEGKMVIKLKIPKSPGEDVIGIGKRVCLECKKEFSSGKALGGHMRVHVQSVTRNENPLKVYQDHKELKQPYYMKSVNDEGKPSCSQCGKTFPSMKSLFGHMRCHPERVWRGILPPPNTAAVTARCRKPKPNSFSSGGGDEVVDLTKYLRGWSVTERRGRKALKAAENDDVLLEAVEDLMSLANGGGSDDESDGNYKYKIKRRKKMKLMLELESEHKADVIVAPLPVQQPASVSECKYKCITCNKCFTTHQALGGHKSSHNKSKLSSTDHHQRCHWSGASEAQAPSSQITSAGEAGSQTGSGRRVLEFDLNEIPTIMMEEDNGNGNGNGNGRGMVSLDDDAMMWGWGWGVGVGVGEEWEGGDGDGDGDGDGGRSLDLEKSQSKKLILVR